MPCETPWTAARVAEALVRAYRLTPGRPVMSSGRGVEMGGAAVEALTWPERYVSDPQNRRILMTWAWCRARGDSVRARYRGLGWHRSTAERRRTAALAVIAMHLNSIEDRSS